MHRIGHFQHTRFEQAAGVGIGQHDGRNIGAEFCFQRIGVHVAAACRRHLLHRETGKRSRGRIGAVRGFGHQNPFAVFAARFHRRADRQKPAQFAMCTGLRRHRHAVHAGERGKPAHQFRNQCQRALYRFLRLQGMNVRKTRQSRHFLIQARIVFHGAGAERIEPAVDRIIHPRQADIVANHLGLRQAGKTDGVLATLPAEAGFRDLGLRQINPRHAIAAKFENQALFMIEAAIPGNGCRRSFRHSGYCGRTALIVHHASTFFSAAARSAQSSSVTVSVTATINKFSAASSRGNRRDAGTPARMPQFAS